MKTRKFDVAAGAGIARGGITASFAFDTNTPRAMSSASISGMFLYKPVISDTLITGIFGQLEKMSTSFVLLDEKGDSSRNICLISLHIQTDDKDESDINSPSFIDADNLSPDIELVLRTLFSDWSALVKPGTVATGNKSMPELIRQNNEFVYYIFERLGKLKALKYSAYSNGLPEPIIRVVTFRVCGSNVTAHSPLSNLTHSFVYV